MYYVRYKVYSYRTGVFGGWPTFSRALQEARKTIDAVSGASTLEIHRYVFDTRVQRICLKGLRGQKRFQFARRASPCL